MRKTFLSFSRPHLGEADIQEVVSALRSGWITTGPKVAEFEQVFCRAVGAPASLALNSGTAALHLALIVAGVGPGDKVITTPLTFCSTIHVIEHVGAQPVLVDVEPDTLNIDPKCIEKAVEQGLEPQRRRGAVAQRRKGGEEQGGSEKAQRRKGEKAPACRSEAKDRHGRVRAILPVHLYGHPCDMESILQLATRHKLAVVEDAAHALPASYKGRMIGAGPAPDTPSVTVLTAFSFYATKNITTAEGGMLTGDPAMIDDARILSLHGMSRDAWKRYSSEGSWYYEVIRPGFKYNMMDIQAALGLQQLQRLPEMQERRRRIFEQYDAAFADLQSIERPAQRPDVAHAYHLYVIRLNLDMLSVDRSQFIEELRVRNIGTSVHFIPNHLHPYYRDKYSFAPEDFPVAYREYKRLVSLPVYPAMTDQDVRDVVEAVREVATQFRR